MTTIRPPRRSSAAHPFLDLLERTGGLPLVIASACAVTGVAVVVRYLIPA